MANRLSKKQLENYGRTIGIELDRRLKKSKLIKELIEHMAKKKGKSIIKKAKEAVKKVVSKNVLLRDASTGTWSEGPQPKGTQTGTSQGVPYWTK
jgi:predicted hydrocarbon binding protein